MWKGGTWDWQIAVVHLFLRAMLTLPRRPFWLWFSVRDVKQVLYEFLMCLNFTGWLLWLFFIHYTVSLLLTVLSFSGWISSGGTCCAKSWCLWFHGAFVVRLTIAWAMRFIHPFSTGFNLMQKIKCFQRLNSSDVLQLQVLICNWHKGVFASTSSVFNKEFHLLYAKESLCPLSNHLHVDCSKAYHSDNELVLMPNVLPQIFKPFSSFCTDFFFT